MTEMTVETCSGISLPPKQDNFGMGGKSGGGVNPNEIMKSYHFLTGEDLYATAKANGLK